MPFFKLLIAQIRAYFVYFTKNVPHKKKLENGEAKK